MGNTSLVEHKSEVRQMPEKKKIGRPTDSPKRHQLRVRLNDADLEKLDRYCKKKGITRVQGIRDGIHVLEK